MSSPQTPAAQLCRLPSCHSSSRAAAGFVSRYIGTLVGVMGISQARRNVKKSAEGTAPLHPRSTTLRRMLSHGRSMACSRHASRVLTRAGVSPKAAGHFPVPTACGKPSLVETSRRRWPSIAGPRSWSGASPPAPRQPATAWPESGDHALLGTLRPLRPGSFVAVITRKRGRPATGAAGSRRVLDLPAIAPGALQAHVARGHGRGVAVPYGMRSVLRARPASGVRMSGGSTSASGGHLGVSINIRRA